MNWPQKIWDFFQNFPVLEFRRFSLNRRGLIPVGFGKKFELFGKNMGFFTGFSRSEVSMIFIETSIYQRNGARRKYELITEKMRRFSEFFSFGVFSVFSKLSRSQSCSIRRKLKSFGKNMCFFIEFSRSEVSKNFSKTLIY